MNNEHVNFTHSFECLMSHLFGKSNFHGTTGNIPFSIWKKYVLRIFKTLKKSIYINVDIADLKFKKDLLFICDAAVVELMKAKNKEILNVLSIEYLVKLVFSLQGNFPNNGEKKSVNLPHNWRLDRFRKVTYMQTDENKVNAIFDYFGNPQNKEEREKVHELYRKRDIDFKGSAFEFVEWFKKEYTDIYLSIF